MSLSKYLGILIVSALLALLVFAPSEARDTHAGAAEPPPNDDFADATVVESLPFSGDPVDIGDATVKEDEPSSSCNFGGVFRTIWYRYTPPEDTVLVAGASTGDSTGGANTAMAVWTNGESGFEEADCDGFPGGSLVARVAFQAEAGTTYLFQVDVMADDPSFDTVFTLDSVTPPANDDFAEAEELGALPVHQEQDVTAGTMQGEEPTSTCVDGFTPRETVWYRLQVERDSFYRFDAGDPVGFSGYAIAFFRGEEFEALEEVLCGRDGYDTAQIGFQAEADEELYVQVVSYTPGRRPIFGPDGTEVLEERGLRLDVQQVELPDCAPPVLRFEDERDDVSTAFFVRVPGEDPDILSVGRSNADGHVCFWVELKDPVEPPPAIHYPPSVGRLEFDLDGRTTTGRPSRLCAGGELLGYDAYLNLGRDSGQLLDIYSDEISSDERNTLSAVALFAGRFVTFVAPAVMFGDDAYHFVLQTKDVRDADRDCAPNRGFYSTAQVGDVNCDGQANAIDAALVLQFDARLISELGCREVADVNSDGTINSIDAFLMLQFGVRLLESLPP